METTLCLEPLETVMKISWLGAQNRQTFGRETEVGWSDCGAARVERPLPKFKKLAKSDPQFKWENFINPSNSRSQKTNCTIGSKIQEWLTLSDPIRAKQAATLATTATSIADNNLAKQLSKWWTIESYASNCDFTGHSIEEQRAIKTLKQTTQLNVEW